MSEVAQPLFVSLVCLLVFTKSKAQRVEKNYNHYPYKIYDR